jgi:ribonuclease R
MSLERRILETLGAPDYQPVDAQGLARRLHVTKKQSRAFREALHNLFDGGKVRKTGNGLLRLKANLALIEGTIKKTTGGAGFLIVRHPVAGSPPRPAPAGPREDIYISPQDLLDAHTCDEVLVQLLERGRREGPNLRGRVVEILTRATRTFVGTYFEADHQGWVQVDGTTLNQPVYVGDPGAKGAQPGDKVVFEMVRFPSQFRDGEGVITQVLGPRGEPGIDTLSIIHEFGLPGDFPEDVLEAARLQAEAFDEDDLQGRVDLTEETIVTIDPADARDFDDAISLTRSENGHWLLGVHIADVAHFVQSGSPLDEEAYRRGTSVYLPDRVIPMLPELISNSLASLQQGKVRYTKSAFMEFTHEGIPVHAEFAHSAIRVTKRFAYEEVMPILNDPERYKTRVSAKVRQLLAMMHELAMLLRARRFAMGALELDMPEVKIDFDKQGKVTGAHVTPHDESHQIIEEFMLAANNAVATALDDHDIPFLRRVHGDPDEAKLRAFGEFVSGLGYALPRFQSRLDLQKLLDKVHGTPHQHAVNYAMLRSMKQATYSPEELGHYALAMDDYCHFTSPIRRYPDLTIHRLVGALIDRQQEKTAAGESRREGKTPVPGIVELSVWGEHCSRTERRAEQAERELVKVKLLTYMARCIGAEYDAIVTGVQDYGFFCQAVEIPAEGLVHVGTLDDDHYYYDRSAQKIVGRRSGRQYRLGDRVRVVVAHVDVDRRQLDFRMAGSQAARDLRRRPPRSGPEPEMRRIYAGGRPGFVPKPPEAKPRWKSKVKQRIQKKTKFRKKR